MQASSTDQLPRVKVLHYQSHAYMNKFNEWGSVTSKRVVTITETWGVQSSNHRQRFARKSLRSFEFIKGISLLDVHSKVLIVDLLPKGLIPIGGYCLIQLSLLRLVLQRLTPALPSSPLHAHHWNSNLGFHDLTDYPLLYHSCERCGGDRVAFEELWYW